MTTVLPVPVTVLFRYTCPTSTSSAMGLLEISVFLMATTPQWLIRIAPKSAAATVPVHLTFSIYRRHMALYYESECG